MIEECPECRGTGSVPVLIGDEKELAPCPSCGGSGKVKVK